MNFGLRGDIDDIMYCLKFHGSIVIGLALAKAQKSLFFTKMGSDRVTDRVTEGEREVSYGTVEALAKKTIRNRD